MKVFLYLRKTEDWNKINKDYLTNKNIFVNEYYQSKFATNDICRQPLVWWNKICKITWMEYREKFKQIATSLWSFPHLTGDSYLNLNDEDIVVPVDDDDWHHPDLCLFLQNTKEYEYGCWNAIVNATAFDFNFHLWDQYHKNICSNGYFFKVSVLKKIGPELSLNVLHNHSQSLEIAKKLKLKIIDKRNSIFALYNWHPGSISVLSKLTKTNDFKKLFPKNNIKSIPEGQSWVKSGVERVQSLIKSIEFNSIPTHIKI